MIEKELEERVKKYILLEEDALSKVTICVPEESFLRTFAIDLMNMVKSYFEEPANSDKIRSPLVLAATNSLHTRLRPSINGEYGRIGWYPITYIYRKVSQKTLINYYKWADIALITPLIDGLNLVCKEFVAASTKGLLILSEFAGSSEDLKEAVKVNPNSIEDLSSTLFRALSMPESEIIERLSLLKERVKRKDIEWWAKKVTDTVKRKEPDA